MSVSPLIAVHMTAAVGAVVTGPIALWARKTRVQRPKLHRAFGYAWVTLMVATALSAVFIHVSGLPNLGGFTPIHLLIPSRSAACSWRSARLPKATSGAIAPPCSACTSPRA